MTVHWAAMTDENNEQVVASFLESSNDDWVWGAYDHWAHDWWSTWS